MVSRLVLCLGLIPLVVSSGGVLAADDEILQIVVSKSRQSLAVYRNGEQVATSNVSTGKAGHSTPTGIFSILEKKKYHESNIYSGSPMPFMQRLTWSGIALHESKHVPAYPASHGCVRLPGKFARTLFDMTERGAHVVISDAPVVPMPITHALLFKPKAPMNDDTLLTDIALRPTQIAVGDKPVEVAASEISKLPPTDASLQKSNERPLRILITRRSDRDQILDVQALLNQLGFEAGPPDGVAGRNTQIAANAYRLAKSLPAGKSVLEPGFLKALYEAAGKSAPPNGQLFVRQNFKPLFNTPVSIREPETELGTHLFLAVDANAATGSADWTTISLENNLPDATLKRLGITKRLGQLDMNAATSALDRIDIPPEVRERIENAMVAGSSLTITDNNLSPETGIGTDFVTVTRASSSKPKG